MSRTSVKIVSKQENKLDIKSWGVVRKIDVDYKEFDEFMTSIKDQVPTLGKQNEYIWPIGSTAPQFLLDLGDQLRALFNLKSEVSSLGFTIYPKAKKVDPNKETKIDHVPTDMALQIGSRIFGTIGSQESLDLFASSMGKKATGNMRLLSENFLLAPMGVSAGLDVKYSDSSFVKTEKKAGFRDTGFKKNPLKRYFIVVDCGIDASCLMKAISNEAKKTSNGDAQMEQDINDKLNNAFGFQSEVDKIVEAANKSDIIVTTEPSKPTELSEIDKIVELTSDPLSISEGIIKECQE